MLVTLTVDLLRLLIWLIRRFLVSALVSGLIVSLSTGLLNAATLTVIGTIELSAEKVNAQQERGPAETHLNQGNAELARGEIDQAILDYGRAIKLDPQYALAYCNRGDAKTAKRDFDGALVDYNRAIAIDPKLAEAYCNRGAIESVEGNSVSALSDFEYAIKLKPIFAGAFIGRGCIREARDDFGGAQADFDRAIEIDSKNARRYVNRAWLRRRMGDYDGSIADANQAIQRNPKQASAYDARGLAKQAKGDLHAALDDLSQATTLEPRYPGAYVDRGLIKFDLGDVDGAMADFQRALELDPRHYLTYMTRGMARERMDDYEGALRDLRKASLAPDQRIEDYAHIYAWVVQAQLGKMSEANELLATYLPQRKPATRDDWVTKISAFLLGRLTEGQFLAAASSPDLTVDRHRHCEAWYYAAVKRALAGDHKTAMEEFNRCLETKQTVFFEYTLSQAALKKLSAAN
jgi:tetratricopeptide (TPR) repeat protein